MTALHEALKSLSPLSASSLPTSSETLPEFLTPHILSARTLISSIPDSYSTNTDPTVAALQKEWKPYKLSAKENPLEVSVYKLSGQDGNGTWFARRSVHEGIGFRRFKKALEEEFETGDGGDNGGSFARAIEPERSVEKITGAMGVVEVNQLTGQFGPLQTRDFVTARLMSSIDASTFSPLSPLLISSAVSSEPMRQFMIISRPLQDHPDCPERQGYVRGQYESTEFIREIPAHSRPTIVKREDEEPGESDFVSDNDKEYLESSGPESTAVEWIMITRSDPHGVPRFIVERGTPGAIVKDAEKFLQWAKNKEGLDEASDTEVKIAEVAIREDVKASRALSSEGLIPVPGEKNDCKPGNQLNGVVDNSQPGLIVSTPAVSSGFSSLAPNFLGSSKNSGEDEDSETSSIVSFATANTTSTHSVSSSGVSIATPSTSATALHLDNATTTEPSSHELRALAKLQAQKEKLDAKLRKQLEHDRERHNKIANKEAERERKRTEKHLKEMEKRERRYKRDIERAEERRKRDQQRIEQRLAKEGEKKRRLEMNGLIKENAELKQRVEELARENAGLRNQRETGIVAGSYDSEKMIE
ncbi:hypothetical protein RUND412_002788 [Rhizina undulata]